jgi:hypothetical protein
MEQATSLEFLQMCYRNPTLGLPVRIRCAMACPPFEHPKLAVTAVVTEHDFATLLDQRIANMQRINNQVATNGNGKVIEAKPVPQIEVKPHMPRINDRRFRRI